jgi:ribosomal protein L37E
VGPLGSLTQRDHRVEVTCRGCGSLHVTRLSMSLTDGTPVDFTSCHRCEHRTWEHAGSELSVEGVLARSRKG